MYNDVKRIVDLFVATVALIALLPLMILVGVTIWLFLGTPVIFRQSRPGLGSKLFGCLKFRTMTDARDENGRLLPDSLRLTRLGKFLRSSSLDELPELINVLAGDMSLVGPRPLLVSYLARYSPAQMRRHEVRPGITGWAQINGRNALDWSQKFAFDVWYVDHKSFWLDLRILVRTVGQVFRRHGIAKAGYATMPEFHGIEVQHSEFESIDESLY
jgi:sugar transferase EpsL